MSACRDCGSPYHRLCTSGATEQVRSVEQSSPPVEELLESIAVSTLRLRAAAEPLRLEEGVDVLTYLELRSAAAFLADLADDAAAVLS
jgi:hypothetical protein